MTHKAQTHYVLLHICDLPVVKPWLWPRPALARWANSFTAKANSNPVKRLTRLWLLCATIGFAVAVALGLLASLLMDGRL